MTEFHLQFTAKPASVSAADGQLTLRQLPTAAEAPTRNYDADALAVLNSIGDKLTELEASLKTRIDQIHEQVAAVAIEVARAVLSDDQQLIQKRVQHYVQIALDQVQPTAAKTVYVHPTCTMPIIRWLAQTRKKPIAVKADVSVSPGDCRIESGESGVAATLEAFLTSVAEQLSVEGASLGSDI